MRLAAIYNVFDGEELLEGSINQIRDHVDGVVGVVQNISNFGEYYTGGVDKCVELLDKGVIDEIILFDPVTCKGASKETAKRQAGLNWAKQTKKFTHVLIMDCDEYYWTEDFAKAKEYISEHHLEGSVVKLTTYFKEPILKIAGFDNYYVPFIHQINPDTVCGATVNYPFCVDPTRKINAKTVELLSENLVYMHHFSWVRKNIYRKVNNSSSKQVIKDRHIIFDYQNAKEGYYVEHYGKKLVSTKNIFNINIQA